MISAMSKEAYKSIIKDLQTKERQVLNAIIILHRATNIEIAKYLSWPLNCVTGRVTSLRKKQKVKKCGTKQFLRTGRQHTVWGLA